jgi:hypothetical protein
MLDEDWGLLQSFLPREWEALAEQSGAMKGLHGSPSAASALRVLLMHVGVGLSLRETAVRCHESGVAELFDVAVLKRLRKSKEWLRQLCLALFREQDIGLGRDGGMQLRAVDATNVREPGKTGSQWRVHYSVQLPALVCDFFKITKDTGRGTGESFRQFPVHRGDYVIADRGYSRAPGIRYISGSGGFVCVRVNTSALPLCDAAANPFPLFEHLSEVTAPGQIACWPVTVADKPDAPIAGRLCVVRKTQAAIDAEVKRYRRMASKRQTKPRPETELIAAYVIVFSTFPERFGPLEILLWYRMRWQIELVFKRFKQLAQLGHLPKTDPESSQAWLYGKLFAALLTEKMIAYSRAFSPWGYDLAQATHKQSVA